MKYLYIFIGAGIGAVARYSLAGLVESGTKSLFPYGTMTVNLIGSFFIGFLWSLFRTTNLSAEFRTMIFVGLLGGFTTFSTFMFETTNLFKDGEYFYAFMNLLWPNLFGILAVILGFKLGDLV